MNQNDKRNVVMAIYFHPEAYPPTLNAIGELSNCFNKIFIVHRPHLHTQWKFPSNVTAVPSGRYISSTEQELASVQDKVLFFAQFVKSFYRACKNARPSLIVVYDSISLLAYRLVRPLINTQHKIWYHNHDVTEWHSLRKFSIGWIAGRTERNAFRYLDIFSLPSNDRLQYFPMNTFRGKYFFIPNYPSKKFYDQFYEAKRINQPIRLIYQGSVGPFHGIEEIIPLLTETIHGFNMELILKGPCKNEFRQVCHALAAKYLVDKRVHFLDVTPYAEVPAASSSCHIGIGILAKGDIMNKTLGTASNKLYEYAAVGLPVLYYNTENFTRYLNNCRWAVPTEVTSDDIRQKIDLILQSYEALSLSAHDDFMDHLNFETGFQPIKLHLNALFNN